MVIVVVLAVVVAMGVGFGVGHLVWKSSSIGTSSPASGSSGSNSGTLPFGSGSYPSSGSAGSPGSGSSSSSGPSDKAAIAAKVDPGLADVDTVLSYESERAAGTGVVLTSNGLVLTNNHVVDGATSITVTDIGNARTYKARVVGYDRSRDIAVIKLEGASGLKVASLGNSSNTYLGEEIVGIGNAGGAGGTPSVAGGTVTGLHQAITATEEDGGNSENLTNLIETDADIVAGDSGGPLVNAKGKVIGMDTAAANGFSLQESGTDGYAIPINEAVRIAKEIEGGDTSSEIHIGKTGFLGVKVLTVTSLSGAEVEYVMAGTPAGLAGLEEGDVITLIDGKAVTSAQQLTTLMQTYHPGDRVQLGWTDSAGAKHTASLKLATGPAA
jgi:S1-C subfamily serine protease